MKQKGDPRLLSMQADIYRIGTIKAIRTQAEDEVPFDPARIWMRYALGKIGDAERERNSGGPFATMRGIAAQVAADLHLAPNFAKQLFQQMAFETKGGTNRGVGFNNFAGLKDSNGNYQHFASPEDFAKRYEQVLSLHRYSGIFDAQNEQEFADIAKRGS